MYNDPLLLLLVLVVVVVVLVVSKKMWKTSSSVRCSVSTASVNFDATYAVSKPDDDDGDDDDGSNDDDDDGDDSDDDDGTRGVHIIDSTLDEHTSTIQVLG